MGSSESILDGDINALKSNDISVLLSQLKGHVRKTLVDYDDIKNKGTRSPLFTMLYFVLRHQNAKDWWSGLSLSEKHVGKAHHMQFHHIFPKSLLRNRSIDKIEINEIANLAFIAGKTNRSISNKEPEDYFQGIIEKRGVDALTSQLVPKEEALWEIKNYQEFLDYRRKQIVRVINDFIEEYKES